MTLDNIESSEKEPEDSDDVSNGKVADSHTVIDSIFPSDIRKKFEIFSYRNAAAILANSFPNEFNDILEALAKFNISKDMIRIPGGGKGLIAKYVDTLLPEEKGWKEARISADLKVKVLHAKKKDTILFEYTRDGFLDGHRIDFLNGKVAFDFEWNSKDQTYDRDLYAFSAFYKAGAIDVGVILTRGKALNNDFFRSLGKVLSKDGTEGHEEVFKKFGASTTWMGKLLYRLDAGRNDGCPVLAIGITPKCIS